MKKFAAIPGLLGLLCFASSAQFMFWLPIPQDDPKARESVFRRAELETLRAEYLEIIRSRLQPLALDDAEGVFGPKIDTPGNGLKLLLFNGGEKLSPTPGQDSPNPVLPLFAPAGMILSGSSISVPGPGPFGVEIDPAANKAHADLYAVDHVGFVGLYYNRDGRRVENAVLYFHADADFIPLKSTNDFAKRLEWEKGRFGALKKWIEVHMPFTDLGPVRISEGGLRRFELGTNVCIVRSPRWAAGVRHPTNTNLVWIERETANAEERSKSVQMMTIRHQGESISFSFDGKFYRLTPEFEQPAQLQGK